MTNPTAKDILALIEAVDPEDTHAMNEIDRCVEQFLEQSGYGWWVDKTYTRSRDALKVIRPEGWTYSYMSNTDGQYCTRLIRARDGVVFAAWDKRTEELAELHAIIQAIEFERGRNDSNN